MKTAWIDPVNITLTSLAANPRWPLYDAGGTLTGRVNPYEFKYDGWSSAGPSKITFPSLPGNAGWSMRETDSFTNKDSAAIIYALLGAAGWAACGFHLSTTAHFHHDVTVRGYRNGNRGWSWNDSKSGACSNLVHHRESDQTASAGCRDRPPEWTRRAPSRACRAGRCPRDGPRGGSRRRRRAWCLWVCARDPACSVDDDRAGHHWSRSGIVAVRFTRALFGGDFDRARRYVAPDSRNALLAVTAGLRDASVSQRSLAAGSLRVHGTSATAILTGTLCSSHSVKPVARTSRDCITNRDPHNDNPVFRVGLKLGPDRRWRVSYGLPRASGVGGAAPAARTP